jgi:hypothetical protein
MPKCRHGVHVISRSKPCSCFFNLAGMIETSNGVAGTRLFGGSVWGSVTPNRTTSSKWVFFGQAKFFFCLMDEITAGSRHGTKGPTRLVTIVGIIGELFEDRFSLRLLTDGELLDEPLLAVYGARVIAIGRPIIGSVGLHMSGFDHVGKVDGKHLVVDKADQCGVLHRKGHLYSTIKVAGHHVRAAEVNLFVASIAKIENAAMLQEAAHDTRNLDVIAHAS